MDGYRISSGMDIYPNILGISLSKEHWYRPEIFDPTRFFDKKKQVLHPRTWIPFSIGERVCPAKSFSLDMLLMLGLKIVTTLELSFEGFVEESTEGELKYYGMSLIHVHPFKMGVKELSTKKSGEGHLDQESDQEGQPWYESALSGDDVPEHRSSK